VRRGEEKEDELSPSRGAAELSQGRSDRLSFHSQASVFTAPDASNTTATWFKRELRRLVMVVEASAMPERPLRYVGCGGLTA
jgi:hypothetical protein